MRRATKLTKQVIKDYADDPIAAREKYNSLEYWQSVVEQKKAKAREYINKRKLDNSTQL